MAQSTLTDQLVYYQSSGGDIVTQSAYNQMIKFVPGEFTDLMSFIQCLAKNASADISASASAVASNIRRAVVNNAFTGFLGAGGLSIYFPLPHMYDSGYKELIFSSQSDWPNFLSAYYAARPTDFVGRLLTLSINGPNSLGLSVERVQREQAELAKVIKVRIRSGDLHLREQMVVAQAYERVAGGRVSEDHDYIASVARDLDMQ